MSKYFSNQTIFVLWFECIDNLTIIKIYPRRWSVVTWSVSWMILSPFNALRYMHILTLLFVLITWYLCVQLFAVWTSLPTKYILYYDFFSKFIQTNFTIINEQLLFLNQLISCNWNVVFTVWWRTHLNIEQTIVGTKLTVLCTYRDTTYVHLLTLRWRT